MPQGTYLPEGWLLRTQQNQRYLSNADSLEKAWKDCTILEGIATLCDEERNLHVRFGKEKGMIPRKETGLGAEKGLMRDIAILSRVGKPVCFRIIGREQERWILSRRSVQEEAFQWFQQNLDPGEIVHATVTHIEQFGAFVDIGCGLVSMIGIENISISRIRHVSERFFPGQRIRAVILRKELQGRITLSHRELLGTWQQNASRLQVGSAVQGVVRGVESYGVFVEIFPNLSGLAEPYEGVATGMDVSVYIKSIIPDRMKVKLTILDHIDGDGKRLITAEDYFLQDGRLRRWQYQPVHCSRHCIETCFE